MCVRLSVVCCVVAAFIKSNDFFSNAAETKKDTFLRRSEVAAVNASDFPEAFLNYANIQLVLDYANWRSVKKVVVLNNNQSGKTKTSILKRLYDCLARNDMFVALETSVESCLTFLNSQLQSQRVNVVTFLTDKFNDETFDKEGKMFSLHGENLLWLMVVSSPDIFSSKGRSLLDGLRKSGLDLDADVAMAVALPKTTATTYSKNRRVKCTRTVSNSTMRRQSGQEILFPFYTQDMENATTTKRQQRDLFHSFCNSFTLNSLEPSYCLLQIYKVRKHFDTSLAVRPLGIWNLEKGTDGLRDVRKVEQRDFSGFPLVLGKKNFSQTANIAEESMIEGSNDETDIAEILNYITAILNSSQELVSYAKLGVKEQSGGWSDLLGGVVKREVDVGIDSVIRLPERYKDMTFTHDIMQSIRNIYIKPQESYEMRDIFVVPFKQNMMYCVIGTIALLTVLMTLYNKTLDKFLREKSPPDESASFSDSMVWCIAIFSMQGSIWQPKMFSGNLMVIVSLLCALIVYNSYSASITSVLSVELTNIRTVDELLESDYDIGYTKNSEDEIYLRSMNITQLNQIYLRGYLHNNINNVSEGLLKTTKGNYGFFATGHVARKQLLNISRYRCIYDIVEIPIKATKNSVAFPMAKRSPYKKLVNLCILRMYETGVHRYVSFRISPRLIDCEKPRTYQSAKLTDLMTAYGVLIAGYVIGLTVLALETAWKRKRQIFKCLARGKAIAKINAKSLTHHDHFTL